MDGIVGTNLVAQVGFVVKDIEKTKNDWSRFLGVPVPPTVGCGDYAITQTRYKGEPAPHASSKLAFMDVGENIQIELIEPNEAPSTWRNFLDKNGEGMHHLAFKVKGMKKIIAQCEGFGLELEQFGEYGDASGRYAYLDGGEKLKAVIELLESGAKE
ncbi:MAG: VOC family protein [Clostridiales bacterium]|jgi:catechol 2,3-dioxygenase-like lactoylglutathione lyase family enzyme|nr:VOC family protein [Clostridiales bacterium]